MDEIYHKVDEQIDKVINNIENSNFDINPKNYNGKNISCMYCKFKDICYKSIKDEVIIETEDNDGVDCWPRKAINECGKNIIVSAGAGSGKTAVLTEELLLN